MYGRRVNIVNILCGLTVCTDAVVSSRISCFGLVAGAVVNWIGMKCWDGSENKQTHC